MANIVIPQMICDAAWLVRREFLGQTYATVKANDLRRINLFDSLMNGDQVCHPPCRNLIMLDEGDTLSSCEIVDHRLVDQRDDYLVTANDLSLSRCAKRKCMCAWSINRLVIHRINTKLTFLVTVANVDVSRCGCKKKPFSYAYVLIRQGIAECAACKTNSLVRLVKACEIKRWQPTSTITDNRR